jgi:hypothetical protein
MKLNKNINKNYFFILFMFISIFIPIDGISAVLDFELQPIITPIDSPTLPSRGFFMGTLANAASGQQLEDAYNQVAQYAEFVPIWGKPSAFYVLADDLAGWWGDIYVNQFVRAKGMFPLFNLSFFDDTTSYLKLIVPPNLSTTTTLSDPAWRQAYKQAAIDVLNVARPKYFSLGNEVNRWYEQYGSSGTPNSFEHFVSLYNEIYDEIKVISSQTVVYCIFAREIQNEYREAKLDFLKMFDPNKLDMLVFTSYPFSVQGTTSTYKIPSNYYVKISSYIDITGKPFGFSELCWWTHPFFGGEQGQSDFINDVSTRLTRDQGLNLHLFGWCWLHDINSSDVTGLIKFDGTEKLGYQTWKTLSGK